jgi:hypothetical protein
MSWLNILCTLYVPENIDPIFVTFSVFQLPMSPLNDEVEQNIQYMLVTDDVSHFEMSPLKAVLFPKPMYSPSS